LIDGQWHSIAVTYNGAGYLSLYVDHALIQTAESVSFNTVGDTNYLGTTNGYGFNYIGDLKNIAFYNYALDASQATVTDTVAPSSGPTAAPSSGPTKAPSSGPTAAPSSGPTAAPSSGRTAAPSSVVNVSE